MIVYLKRTKYPFYLCRFDGVSLVKLHPVGPFVGSFVWQLYFHCYMLEFNASEWDLVCVENK